MKNLKDRFTILIATLYLLGSCSIDDGLTNQAIKLRMMGTFERPTGATGSFEPINQTYEIQSIILINADGSESNLYTGVPIEARIINRPLLVHEQTIEDDFVGVTLAGLRVVVSQTVKGSSKYNKNHVLTLPSEDISYTESFIFPEGQSLVFTVLVQWRGTVTRDDDTSTDIMTVPTFRVLLTES